MKSKRIKTMSGAAYLVTEDGDVERLRGDKDMSYTLDGSQYEEGFLQHWAGFDDLAVGGFIHWQGVINEKYTQPIRSSLIESITEEDK